MSYTSNNWQTGDIVTAQKLNNIEQGIKDNEPLVITGTYDGNTVTFDVSADDAVLAINNGIPVVINLVYPYSGSHALLHYAANLKGGSTCYHYFDVPSYADGTSGFPLFCVRLVEDENGPDSWDAPYYARLPDLSISAMFDSRSENQTPGRVLMFTDDWGGSWQQDTVEDFIELGEAISQIVSAAQLGAETQKTTLSVAFYGDDYADSLYGIMNGHYSGTYTSLSRGRGAMLGFYVGTSYCYMRCVSALIDGSMIHSAFSGDLAPSVAMSGGTITDAAIYPITLDLVADEISGGGHWAVATVSVEKISSTIVPMS